MRIFLTILLSFIGGGCAGMLWFMGPHSYKNIFLLAVMGFICWFIILWMYH